MAKAKKAKGVSGPLRLVLIVKKVWFDKIASGKKKKEYRSNTNHWRVRLLDDRCQEKQFDELEFRNGYQRDAPRMVFKCGSIELRSGQFEISIGERLDAKP